MRSASKYPDTVNCCRNSATCALGGNGEYCQRSAKGWANTWFLRPMVRHLTLRVSAEHCTFWQNSGEWHDCAMLEAKSRTTPPPSVRRLPANHCDCPCVPGENHSCD